jgi:hypothetical protein
MSFANLQCVYEPFPFGVARGVFPADVYEGLLDSWPATELFQFMPLLGKKYSLSEVNNPAGYRDFLRSSPAWYEFHRWLKSEQFIAQVLTALAQANIDLGLRGERVCRETQFSSWPRRAWATLRKRVRQWTGHAGILRARFEFSMMPAGGGFIKPHTDHYTKVITLVSSVVREGEWDASWGGGTAMLTPKDITRNFNFLNHQGNFEDFDILQEIPFEPNQCLFFVKTFNSHHAVFPMKGGSADTMRRTLTINIERVVA